MTDSRPNILVVVMDTARFDTVNKAISDGIMSNVGQVLDDGTLYTECWANAPWTLPSHASVFTGQYASDHGAHAGTKQFDPGVLPLAERLTEQGYRTGAYSNNTWISPEFGFDCGFDDYLVRWELVGGGKDPSTIIKAPSFRKKIRAVCGLFGADFPQTVLNILYSMYLHYADTADDGATRTTSRLINWVDQRDERPFFLFANYTEPHLEYDPPENYRYRYIPEGTSRTYLDNVHQAPWKYTTGTVEMTEKEFNTLSALYLAELDYLDDQLGRLFHALRTRNLLDETAIFVLGDHGENIGDHGLMDHQYCVRESLTHVPLLCRYPPVFSEAECDALIELRDLYPTISLLAGDELSDAPPSVSQHGIQTVDVRSRGRDYVVSEYLEPQPSVEALRQHTGQIGPAKEYDRALRSVRTDAWTYIESSDGDERLYDRNSDPRETENVAEANRDVLADLRQILYETCGKLIRNPGIERTISGNTKQRLEDMGYLQ